MVDGGMWHGPSLGEATEGLSAAVAAAHPIEGAHSIWELVLHAGQWAEIVGERLARRDPEVGPERNFPPVVDVTEAGWSAAVDGMKRRYRALADLVAGLDADALRQEHAGAPGLVAQIEGVVEHGAYHAGQIVLLRRAAGAWPVE